MKEKNKEEKNHLNVCMITDLNQFDFALSSMLGTSKRTNETVKYHLIVEKKEPDYISKVEKVNYEMMKNSNSSINLVDASKFNIPRMESNLEHITWVTNLRIFIPKILSDVNGHILYLDNDTYVDGDISEVFKFSKGKKGHFGRSRISDFNWKIELGKIANKKDFEYFNAGVLILDIDKLREDNFVNKAIDFYENYSSIIKYADQDIINAILDIEEFVPNFNIARDTWKTSLNMLNDEYNVKIFHFLSYSKPWDKNEFNLKMIDDIDVKGTVTIDEYNKMLPAREKWIAEYESYLNIIKI